VETPARAAKNQVSDWKCNPLRDSLFVILKGSPWPAVICSDRTNEYASQLCGGYKPKADSYFQIIPKEQLPRQHR
jgi:hypothetical protein